MGGDPFYLKFWVNRPPLERNRRFSIYFCPYIYSASAITCSEKSSINTNREVHYALSGNEPKMIILRCPYTPQGWLKNAKGPKLEQYAAITPKRYEIGCQLGLITNRKSHTGFRLISSSMTLHDLERRNSPYFAFFSPN